MKKLIEVQAALKAPKGQFNKFGGYAYRSCEDILEAVKPLLAERGMQLTLSDEPVEVGGRVYIKATACVTDGSESATATAYAREAESKKGMDESQVTGTASSYARKYALNGLFLIDDTKDADATNQHGRGQQQARRAQQAADPLKAAKARLWSAIKAHAAATGCDAAATLDALKADPESRMGDAEWIAALAARYEEAAR